MLEGIVQSSKLFIDTCSLMHNRGEDFFLKKLKLVLLGQHKRVIIPEKVINEVARLRKTGNFHTKNAASRGAAILRDYINHRLVDVRGEPSDPFADSLFQYIFMKFRTRYNLTLLTQDRRLAQDILRIKTVKSVKSNKNINALYLGMNAELLDWKKHGKRSKISQNRHKSTNRFKVCKTPIQGSDRQLGFTLIPKQGDFIKSQRLGKLKLESEIGAGGEGMIFSTQNGQICKVYFKDKLTSHKRNKLHLMINKPVNIPGVCWPLDTVHNNKGEFIGYLMPKAEGIPMQKAMFIKALLEKNFPHWKREHLVTLAINILEGIRSLHDRNVLIGDINPLNILIKSEKEVFFVDTDSYQIDEFPCPVGMANFTAPEIQGKNYSTFLRTLEHEHFAVATLLFMILLPGKPPYSHQGGGDPLSNIRKGIFPYPFGKKSNKKAPDGCWRYIWSNLPYRTKEAFYNCFTDNNRPTVDEWLVLMRHYKKTLVHSNLTNELFTTSLKPISNHAQETYGAANNYIELLCDACGNAFSVHRNKARKMKNSAKQFCQECFQQCKFDRENVDWLTCETCFASFLFSEADKRFYSRKSFAPPKRCPDCRKARKEQFSENLFTKTNHNVLLQNLSYKPKIDSDSNNGLFKSLLYRKIF